MQYPASLSTDPVPDPVHQTGALQQLQLLMAGQSGSASHQVRAVTLADVAMLIQSMQERYGSESTLEEIIQTMVGRQLQAQVEQRRAARRGGCS